MVLHTEKQMLIAAGGTALLISANVWAILYYLRIDPAAGFALFAAALIFGFVYFAMVVQNKSVINQMRSASARIISNVVYECECTADYSGKSCSGMIFAAADCIGIAVFSNKRVGFKRIERADIVSISTANGKLTITDSSGAEYAFSVKNAEKLIDALGITDSADLHADFNA